MTSRVETALSRLGADRPLFSVPEGRMAVGMGIHGEPGINETDIPTADELAERLHLTEPQENA